MKKKIFKQKVVKIHNIINGKQKDFYVKEMGADTCLIDYLISGLDMESQRIIYFDFVYNNNKYWWREYYSKSTYYRLKNIAMDTFLEKALTYDL